MWNGLQWTWQKWAIKILTCLFFINNLNNVDHWYNIDMNISNLSNICLVSLIQIWSLQIVQIIYKNYFNDDKYNVKYI